MSTLHQRATGLSFTGLSFTGLIFTGLASCASTGTTSTDLQRAREMVQQASQSEAVRLAPAELLDAREALGSAELASREAPGSYEERHYAYLAQRRALLAMSEADRVVAERDTEAADDAYLREQTQVRRQAETRAEALGRMNAELHRRLDSTSAALADVRRMMQDEAGKTTAYDVRLQELRQREAELEQQKARLEEQVVGKEDAVRREQQARLDAEARARAALERLDEVAQVDAGSRETTITLSGAVLFETGQDDLLANAEDTLDVVAEALDEQGEDKEIIVEGHADASGNARSNEELSRQRAQAVRRFLVDRGVDPKQIRAVGRGEEEPVASNATPEGRANNRRVEIIVRDAD